MSSCFDVHRNPFRLENFRCVIEAGMRVENWNREAVSTC